MFEGPQLPENVSDPRVDLYVNTLFFQAWCF